MHWNVRATGLNCEQLGAAILHYSQLYSLINLNLVVSPHFSATTLTCQAVSVCNSFTILENKATFLTYKKKSLLWKLPGDFSIPATNSIITLSKLLQWLRETEQYLLNVNTMFGHSLCPLPVWPWVHCPSATEDASAFPIPHSLSHLLPCWGPLYKIYSILFPAIISELKNIFSCSC